jgi:hypothetical protein
MEGEGRGCIAFWEGVKVFETGVILGDGVIFWEVFKRLDAGRVLPEGVGTEPGMVSVIVIFGIVEGAGANKGAGAEMGGEGEG